MSRLLPLRYCSDRFARSSHGYTCYPFIYPSVYNEVLYVCSVVNSVQHANYHCTSVQLLYKCSVSIPSEQCSDYEHLFSATTTPPYPPICWHVNIWGAIKISGLLFILWSV